MRILSFVTSILILSSFDALALDVKQRFSHLDTNKNGYLTHDELEPQPQLLSTFLIWDKDQDNQISLIEFKNYLTNNLY
ncbi:MULTISPECIES: EF-hand domain-containing protein [Pseudoalteromonas]|uniref:Calcium dependent protein n=1 Tax=Pseudoalteromonas fuliginea TaxID=1872678 RepID=A0ABD3Y4Q8_9GAMM|nr:MULTISPECIES: calcium dependent protein [Pseudoalteromonas]ALQ07336.1 calcium dependent protein [Pseudoalteromonas sp. Bsw20308]KAA1150579.1 EF-hand domain-containing protein [Pseudoalteromonas fuliginea]KAA1165318.1 EF-hand domain-containing protein [Pseudoalteromonas fuliginea]KDC49111.1 calcium dependent protein [Pseudoalteromonas fuliginea]KDC55700.1 calcium dependent protein [Pseudoalteromonas sp. S3431]